MLSSSTFAAVLMGALSLSLAFAIFPSFLDYGDDHGDGLARVELPAPGRVGTYRRRTVLFFVTGSALTLLAVGLRRYVPGRIYTHTVGAMATNLTGQPAE